MPSPRLRITPWFFLTVDLARVLPFGLPAVSLESLSASMAREASVR
jgi:hypothetical protein